MTSADSLTKLSLARASPGKSMFPAYRQAGFLQSLLNLLNKHFPFGLGRRNDVLAHPVY